MPDITFDDEAITNVLRSHTNIALIGASSDSSRASNRIFSYLQDAGYNVIPVTPKPDLIHGVEPAPTLLDAKDRLNGRIDMVDVFRASHHTPAIAHKAVELGAKSLWLQFHTVHPDAVRIAVDGGLDTIVDRCIKIEHARLMGNQSE